MNKIDFSNIAGKYREISTVQKSASENLFNLLDIKSGESVLDAGCGTGNLTSKIKAITKSRVVGVDVSEGMINEAVKNYGSAGIEFLAKSIHDINYDGEFDVIFCNSTFQWFKNIEVVLKKMHNSLKHRGRIAIQAPASEYYCPNFVVAISHMKNSDAEFAKVFSSFKSPWLFFENEEAYAKIFEEAKFKVAFSTIECQSAMYTPEKVFEIFSSGAIAGYLNQDNYSVKIDDAYIERFKNLIKIEIARQADNNGLVKLIFNRIYLLAFKL
jgi:trans-aconitate methyltransferase